MNFIQAMLWSLPLVLGRQLQGSIMPTIAPTTGETMKPPIKLSAEISPTNGGGLGLFDVEPAKETSTAPFESCNLKCKQDSGKLRRICIC